ncbi:MAG TPA: J domain-containing protein [Hyphomicrobium sp.]|uniref:J domain-containing protein n=1 Tax=Hyphomicrobium sp. TaxID=82 RepID=UPI002B78DC28|nr:J domain-containing protein [Hyphomicrobium sp.]HRN87898.1 J domain-containing protein [Hyphomicrobium sp.]
MVVVIVGLYLVLFWYEPQTHIRIGFGALALGYVVAWYVPIWFKHRHVNAQNRLLDRCRALLILGSRAYEDGDKLGAEAILKRIRRLEGLWKLGNAIPFRLSLALWALAFAVVACVMIRFAGLVVAHYGWKGKVLTSDNLASELGIALIVSMTAPLYALMGYFDAWKNEWAIENCGDRLWQLLYGPRDVAAASETESVYGLDFDGMSARELFGLGYRFTRRELDSARRKLVKELHPDRWYSASPRERKSREEALKRVNAAYDSLRAEAA